MTSMPLDDGIKAAYHQIASGDAFDRSFEGVIGSVQSIASGVQTKITSIPTQINGVAESIMAKAKGVESMITGSMDRIPAFAAHVEGQFNSLMDNISTFASAQGLENALAGKAGGCSNLKDFFGSITTKGPEIFNQVKGLVDSVSQEVDHFKQLGTSLQQNIMATKDEIVAQLNAEIASAGADITRLTDLNAMKQTVLNEFQSGVAEVRADLTRQAQSYLSTQRQALLTPLLAEMRKVDFSILTSAEGMHGFAQKIDQQTGLLSGIISGETNSLTGAVTKLERLGAATSMRSLFGGNPCVQTLMGFVGKTDFLKNLKI